jgi:hypothetical protein
MLVKIPYKILVPRSRCQMFSVFQRACGLPAVARPCLRVYLSAASPRSISTTPTRCSTDAPEPPTPEEEAELEGVSSDAIPNVDQQTEAEGANKGRSSQPQSYNEFLSTLGAKYKFGKPQNWLGGDVVSDIARFWNSYLK